MLVSFVIFFYILICPIHGDIAFSDKRRNEIEKQSSGLHRHPDEYPPLEYHPCKRRCEQGTQPLICRYHFEIENYHTLSKACYNCPLNVTDCFRKDCVPGDGTKRGIVTINRQIPGPAIEVCHNDIVVVDVLNKLISEGTTIHWHGIHQIATPYMDGVPYITQCPIPPHDTFRYTFQATEVGTHFYHSHIGMQRIDGAYGSLIVRVPEEENPHIQHYDHDLSEHTLVIIDWTTEMGLEAFLAHHHNNGSNKAPMILINGLGRYKEFDNGGGKPVYMPTARFKVEGGHRYRFRVINAGFLNCPVEMTIDNHMINLISSDGSDVMVTPATSLVTYAGERFDFILIADQPPDLYWIRFKGNLDCGEGNTRAVQVAVLQYHDNHPDFPNDEALLNIYPAGEVTFENAHIDGLQINPINIGTEINHQYLAIPYLESVRPRDESLKEIPDFKFYISYDFYNISHSEFFKPPYYGFFDITNPQHIVRTPQFNHITMEIPPFPLLSQRDEFNEDMFCNNDTIQDKDCDNEFCSCPHAIKVPLGAVVELVIIDEGVTYDANHPVHLHGYAFRVVALERLGKSTTVAEVKERDARGLIRRNLGNPPLKDTVTVPDGGYTVVRFRAINPGYWLFHCHLEFHAEIGMAMVIQVGEKHEMLPVPYNFPRCGDYLFDPMEAFHSEKKS